MDAPQCVHPYVPSDCMLYWMFYYTHHSDMDAPSMYTLVYLQIISFSECIIKHTTQYVHSTVCILR